MKFNKKQTKQETAVQPMENTQEPIKEIKLVRGDTVTVKGQVCKVVEVLETNRWHVKNTQAPFNSFIITENDLNG